VRIEIDEWASRSDRVRAAASVLAGGGVVAMPTDSGYALACDLFDKNAVERVYDLKQSPRSHPLSILLADPDEIGRYAGYVSSTAYRTMKRLLPGPYVFILEAGPEIPKILVKRRSEIGVRVPAAEIPRAIVRALGRPLACTSLRIFDEDGAERFVIDPADIDRELGRKLDAVIDGGPGIADPTSVVDLRDGVAAIIREGQGDVSLFR
jgi:tRNA threonylcarbamoyl adenosine modification protein (Sua5/YciO/YrdC/YwlC family)